MPRKSPFYIELSDNEAAKLKHMAAQYTSPYFSVVRAKLVLLAAKGLDNDEIAQRLDLPRQIVSKWRKRFYEHRLKGLNDEPRSGRPPGFPPSDRRSDKGAGL